MNCRLALLVALMVSGCAGSFKQEAVQTDLSKSSLDLLAPGVVEAELLHKGFDIAGVQPVQVDLTKLFATSPKELCDRVLSCDAVIFGKVLDWDRGYYGIQTVNSVDIELKMLSAKDGRVLFESRASDSDSRGITKGPTGFSNLVLEPIRGLDSDIITTLARNTVAQMVEPLKVSSRPDFLSSSPPAILASGHDQRDGIVNRGEGLTVVALGTPGQVASFLIGTDVDSVPMVERSSGHYIGEYIPPPNDRFSHSFVSVAIRDKFGRVTTHQLAKRPLTLQ
jgi:hypothetical protein